jgi:hypothetical protein
MVAHIEGRGGRRLRMIVNSVLRGIFGPERDEKTGEWKNYIMKILMIFTSHQILFVL